LTQSFDKFLQSKAIIVALAAIDNRVDRPLGNSLGLHGNDDSPKAN
jgi:hypothetical protein